MGRGLVHCWILALAIIVSRITNAHCSDGETSSLIQTKEITNRSVEHRSVNHVFRPFKNGKDIPFVADKLDKASWISKRHSIKWRKKKPKKDIREKLNIKYDNSCECGVPTDKRIVNGVEAAPHSWPWMVNLEDSSGSMYFCGGSIISDRYVLTAAHCIVFPDKDIYVRIGDHDKNSDKENTQRIQAKKVNVHPNYDPDVNMAYDVAVIRLKQKIKFSKFKGTVAPLCLGREVNQVKDYVDVDVIVAGWGTTSSGGSQATVLMEVGLKTMSNKECTSPTYWYTKDMIDDSMICAAGPDKDACQGDSGGPLFHYNIKRQRYEQVGIVSWGIGCADKKYPGVYSRVTLLEKWILKRAKKSKFCSEGK